MKQLAFPQSFHASSVQMAFFQVSLLAYHPQRVWEQTLRLATWVRQTSNQHKGEGRELWTAAEVSRRARKELGALGWKLDRLPPTPVVSGQSEYEPSISRIGIDKAQLSMDVRSP